jgi:small ligand-binding sensory domain FIST
MPGMMRWSSALSTRASLEAAVTEVVDRASSGLEGTANLGFLFIAAAFASEYARVMPLLREKLPNVPIIGCGGGGIVGWGSRGQAEEIEDDVAISLTLASLPDVMIHPFHIDPEQLPDLDGAPNAWVDLVGVAPELQPQFVILLDPMSSGINDLLAGLDYAYAGLPKIGGLTSPGVNGSSGLFCGDRYYRAGAVGVALSGNIVLDTIVAQGCRPVGNPYWVTASERNIILGLRSDGDAIDAEFAPLEMLRKVVDSLEDVDQELAKNSLFVGIAQNAFKQTLTPGDFLVRNLLGFDPQHGALAIGDRIRSGQRIQFHLRDASASAEDLASLLQDYQQRSRQQPSPAGALMFACMGRGRGLYGEANFDSGVFNQYLPTAPLAGFFCNGEIGPVGGATFLHGYTAVFGIFRSK